MIPELELDSGIRIGIKAWFVGMGIGVKLCWNQNQSKSFRKHGNRNQNRDHLLLESELESETLIFGKP